MKVSLDAGKLYSSVKLPLSRSREGILTLKILRK